MSEEWNHIVCIDDWVPDESSYDKGYYPEGTREKAVYFSPSNIGNSPLRSGWRYLFKKSRSWAPWQFWMEIMAYRIGQVMGVAVPPAYVGLSNLEKPGKAAYGALIEWFYGQDERYVPGAGLIGPTIDGFDYKSGDQHNLQTILKLFLSEEAVASDSTRQWVLDHWAKVLTFDAIIGNVDRHQENWGLIAYGDKTDRKVRWSPAFDNGTAMSYEQLEENLGRFDDEAYIVRYLTRPKRARHHMRWDLMSPHHVNFYEFLRRYVSEYPETSGTIMAMLEFTEGDLRSRLEPLVHIAVEDTSRLTQRRLDLTLKLVMKRTELLRDALER